MVDNGSFGTNRWTSEALSLLRIVTGLLFLQHGTAKILGFPYWKTLAFPEPFSMFWLAGWIELIGATLLILGFLTRPAAFLLAGEMAVAYWLVHAPKSFFPILNDGEAAILFCFIFLLFAAGGPGKWSVDCWLRRNDEDPDVVGYAGLGGERQYRPEDFGDKAV